MIIANVIGNIGADAQKKELNGREYITFRMCSTIKRNGQEVSTWVSVLYRYNEGVIPYLKKGAKVFISGEASVRDYTTHDGKAGSDFSVFANTLQLIGAKVDSVPVAKNDQLFKDKNDDEELPF